MNMFNESLETTANYNPFLKKNDMMDVKIQIKLHVLCNYISFYSLQLKKSKSRSGQFEARVI